MDQREVKKWHYRCCTCNGENLQAQTWYYLNTGEFASGDPPHDDVWCDDCQTEVDITTVCEYEDGTFGDYGCLEVYPTLDAALSALR